MVTTVLSGRVSARKAASVGDYLRHRGLTWNEAINEFVSYVDRHQRLPWDDVSQEQDIARRLEELDELERIGATIPAGTFLSSLSDEGIRQMLEERSDV